jgi:BirA family biotin operon repressor/biotin-[acetyl-CoA-carboxylase] ligase
VVHLPQGEVHGVATGIDADGRLCLDTDGGPYAVAAGDVVHVR